MKFRFFIILLLLLPLVNAAIFSVGVSPGTVNVGDVSPGETKIVKFSIFSVSDEPLLVYLSSENSNLDFFSQNNEAQKSYFSEESAGEWIEFLSNPVEIDPEIRKNNRGWTDINLLLHVPQDSEPGYHVIHVTPTPTIFGGPNAPIGASISAIAKVSIIFNVRGDAKREGIILDTTEEAYSIRGFTAKTFFQNTGTTTLYAVAKNTVYDLNGSFLGEFESSHHFVKPGLTLPFKTRINGEFPEGVYKMDSKVTYTTGEAEKTKTIELSAPITGAAVEAPTETPWMWVILIVIIIIIAVWWYREKRR